MTIERPRITDIYQEKVVTRRERNEFGQWEDVQKELRFKIPINDLSSGLRLVNFIIDVIIFEILAYVLQGSEFTTSFPLVRLAFGFIFPIYYLLGEFYFQQTIGKIFTKSIVVDEYGDKPDFKTVFIRTLIRFVPFEPFSFFGEKRGWHDKWTKTYVIRKDELEKIKELIQHPENLKV